VKRVLRRVLPVVLALLLLVTVVLGWLAGTESGLQFLWRRVIAPAVPELAIGRLEGRLAGPLRLADLRYDSARFLFAAGTLELDWSPAALRGRVLHIERLAGTDVRYEQRTADEDGGPVQLPARLELPLALELADLAVRDLVIVGAPDAEPLAFDSVTLAGSYRATALDVTRLAVRQPAFSADGALTLQTRDDFPVTGAVQWQATPPGYAPVEARTDLSGSLQALHVAQVTAAPYALRLDLTLNEPLAELRLDGHAVLEDSDLAAINAAWPAMRLTGRIAASGPVTALALDGALDVQDPRAGALQLALAGTLLPDALQFDTLRLAAAEGPTRLEAQGRIGFGAQPVFDFEAQWQALAWPLTGAPDYASRQGHFTLAGTPEAYRLDAAGDLRIRDLLAGDLVLRAGSADTPGNWRIELARLAAGDSHIEASGQAGAVFDLAWRVAAPHLDDLVPQASGRLEGSGSLSGALPQPSLALQVEGAGIAWQGYRLGTLAVDAVLDLAAGRKSRLEATLGDARLPGVAIRSASMRGSGTTARHQVHLETETDQGGATLDVNGRWDGTAWRFDLRDAVLTRSPLAPWRLAAPVSGELTQARFALPDHCWTSGRARACGRFAADAGTFDGAFTLADLPLAYFAAFFPERVDLQGELGGQGEFTRPAGQAATARVRLDTTPLQLGLPGDETAPQQRFTFAPAQAAFTLQRAQAAFEVDLPFADGPGGVRARADLALPAGGEWLQGRLNGELELEWPDIGLASRWLPEVAELGGRIDGRLQVDGTPAAPRLEGRLALTGGTATLVTPGLKLEDVQLELAGQPAGDVRITASAASGGGTLRGDGFASPVVRTAALTVRGEQFQVMNTPEAKIFASPDLQLAMDSTQATLTGRIDIPRAELRPRKPPPSAVSVSADQVIVVEDGQTAAAARYPVTARVRIVLGDAVDIDGLGLTGKLRGDVRVSDTPGQPATASGELSIVDGHYEAYGQDLDIRTGRLLYAGGAVTAPGLDIEAVRKPAPDLVVGVRARGQLRAPTFTVFSEPVMPQSEQLSWLVLGRPLEGGTSDSERSAMQAAALMLGLSGGDMIGKRVGEELGLDEVTVGTDPGEGVTQASLLVGKYLSPKLFVSYGIGLFEPVATLRLRYALSSRWKLVGQAAAAGSSADLFYEIERRK
jgi:translocation and assembly module TamB